MLLQGQVVDMCLIQETQIMTYQLSENRPCPRKVCPVSVDIGKCVSFNTWSFEMGAEVFKVSFWMRKHKALTWKRTWIWSTSSLISKLDLGPLLAHEKPCDVKTTKQWIDPKTGRKRFQGTRNLRSTQCLDHKCSFLVSGSPSSCSWLGWWI